MHKIAMLGAGLIGRFYTMSLLGFRGKDEIKVVCAGHPEEAAKFAREFGIPRSTADMAEAIRDPEVDTVIVGLPNYLHKQAVLLAAEAGKAVLCTKPLATSGPEALEMLEAVEKAGVFHGYLEDLVYTPKTLKALDSTQKGRPGQGAVGALARDPRRTAQRLVLEQRAFWRRGNCRYGLPLHRDRSQFHRQRQSPARSILLGGYTGSSHRCRRSCHWSGAL